MLRPWDIRISFERTGTTPTWLQIANTIVDAIRSGSLAPGSALPGTRELATRVGVNRKTIQQSYGELIAQGWLTATATRGTFVSALLPIVDSDRASKKSPRSNAALLLRREAPDLLLPLAEPNILKFDDGAPDTRLMPAELVVRAYRRALLNGSRRNLLGYGDPRGTEVLRQAVADMLNADRGLNCTADNICITRGSQMGIFLATRLLAQSGDTVVTEVLSYPPAREAFRAAGAAILSVGLDESGMRVDELEACCRKMRIRAVYVTPHHQFPTTVVMPPERRIRLLALADQFDFTIVEDDYDHEFHFGHRPMLPLASARNWGRVLYIGSLSKILSPSLRVGYLVATPEVIERAAAEIMMIDRQGDPAMEAAAADLMSSGALKSHTRKVLRSYVRRRECLANALRDKLANLTDFTLPQGGLALWVEFVKHIDLAEFCRNAQKARVGITPGQAFATNGYITNGARLGFGSLDERELREAVGRLKVPE
ncbi:MAG: PLP-dependent aminotransferase family protein [Acidiphilium sp.]|nr:PLP-dependent aminotransferase family protein [Acidiphilium sp.]MDD4936125.1 PLP-dependent aminotransferase family protein [Acidiphilium sp.]